MFRPDSPPPRQPSPDFLPAPLPCPHHARRIQSQPKIRVHSPTVPPGLHTRTKTLQSARSCDYMSTTVSKHDSCSTSSLRSALPRTRSHLTFSPDTSPSSSPAPSGRNSPEFIPHHRRTLSVAFPFPSTPSSRSSSPIIDSQVPPVPLVPYRYTGPQHIICPKPVSVAKQIVLPDIEEVHQVHPYAPSTTNLEEKPSSQREHVPVPPLEKHKSMGIACLKFFGLRTPTRQPRTAMAAM